MIQETVIIRNTCIKSLYDVVKINYLTEDVEYLAKAVDFESAQGILAECDTPEIETTI
jgi:hypothetical protein